MRRFLMFLFFAGTAYLQASDLIDSFLRELGERSPFWRAKTVSRYAGGGIEKVNFYEVLPGGRDKAVRETVFFEDGTVKQDSGAVKVTLGSPAATIWGSTVVPDGISILFSPTGIVEEVSHYKAGFLDGALLRFFDNGELSYEANYKAGQKDGKEKTFQEDGTQIAESVWKEGSPIGLHWRNGPKGKRAYEAEYDTEGNLKSPIIEFYPNGNRLKSYFLKDGKLDGTYIEWDVRESTKVQLTYAMGVLEGHQVEYYPFIQTPKKDYTLMNGMKEGICREFYEDGAIKSQDVYLHNVRTREFSFYPNGYHKRIGNSPNGIKQGLEKEFYEDGSLKHIVHYKDGLLNGSYHTFYESSGLPQEEASYKAGVLHGTRTLYDALGNVIDVSEYVDGVKI